MVTGGSEQVAALLARSNRLGADPTVTNYAGGNTSCKAEDIDPVTGEPVELLWVKGSGGDLGTLTEKGLAVLRLDRLRSLAGVYRGIEREDEMVAAFDYCLHGRGGAAPSIDTAMHGLVDAAHVDHLHPDAGIALATAADGEELTRRCFDGVVAWVPWRRPGFQLGLDIAETYRAHPDAIGVILGGHGITAWGSTSEECEARSLEIIRGAQAYIDKVGRAEPFGQPRAGYEALSETARRARAAALAPVVRGLASTDQVQLGHFDDDAEVLDFIASSSCPRLVELGTSCPDHFLRTKVRPLLVDLPATADLGAVLVRLRELHASYRDDYRAYYERHADADSPPMRGADPAIVLVPGVGMFSFGKDAQTARVAGEFYRNAIRVMRGAEAISTYAPIPESGEVPHRVLAARGSQAEAAACSATPRGAGRAGHWCRIRDRAGHRAPAGRRRRLCCRGRPRRALGGAGREGTRRQRRRCRGRDGRDERGGRRGRFRASRARVRRRRPRRQQRRAVDLQAVARDDARRLGPPARRDGARLVPRVPGPPQR